MEEEKQESNSQRNNYVEVLYKSNQPALTLREVKKNKAAGKDDVKV